MSKESSRPPLWSQPPLAWLFSLRVGLVLLAILTIASIYGTMITPLERAQALVFYSWWYICLLFLLAVNMGCSTWRTIVERILPQRRPHFMRVEQFYETTAASQTVPFRGNAGEVAEAFRRRGFRAATEGAYGYAARGLLGRWGAPIAHLGFVIVLLGSFASKWTSREGFIQLREGGQTDEMLSRADQHQKIPLGFTVRCEDFDTSLFPKTQIPSHFVSTITILDGERPELTAPVEVNRSVKKNGWKLHQTSYEKDEESTRYQLAVKPSGGATTITLEVTPGQRRTIPGLGTTEIELAETPPFNWSILEKGKPVQQGTLAAGTVALSNEPLRLHAEQFEPDFVMDEGNTITSRSNELNNPALKVSLIQGEKQISSQWLFGREELKAMMHGASGPYVLDLTRVTGQAPHWVFHVSAKKGEGGAAVESILTIGKDAELGATHSTAAARQDSPTSPSVAQKAAKTAGPDAWNVQRVKSVPAYATVLTLTRNSMIPVIYGGCAIMILGLMVTFFIRRREVWFWVDEPRQRLRVAAIYRHPQSELDAATRGAVASLAGHEAVPVKRA